jgi:hypothetical protein
LKIKLIYLSKVVEKTGSPLVILSVFIHNLSNLQCSSEWHITIVYPPIAGISALGECVNDLIYNAFCEMGFFVPEIFVHTVWF